MPNPISLEEAPPKYIVASSPSGPKYPPEVLLRLPAPNTSPETLTHSWTKPIFWQPPPLPSENLSSEEKIRWLDGHATDLGSETGTRTQCYYNGEFLRLINDPNLNPESNVARSYVGGFVNSYITFQKSVAEKGFSEDLPIGAVVDFREDATNFFLNLDERGLLSESQYQKLVAEGKMPTREMWKLISQQKEITEAFQEAVDGRENPGQHAQIVGRVYETVASICRAFPGAGMIGTEGVSGIATTAAVIASKAAPAILHGVEGRNKPTHPSSKKERAVRVALNLAGLHGVRGIQEITGVAEGRNILHSTEKDKPQRPTSKKEIAARLAVNLLGRLDLGMAATLAAAFISPDLMNSWPAMLGIFGAAFVAPSIKWERPGFLPKTTNVDYGALVRSGLRGIIPGALILGADAILRQQMGINNLDAATAVLAVPAQLLLLRAMAGSLFAGLGANIGPEGVVDIFDPAKGASKEFAQWLHFKETMPDRAENLLSGERSRKDSRWKILDKALGPRGWAPLADLVEGNEMTPEETLLASQSLSQMIARTMSGIIDNPTRYSLLIVDVGQGKRETIDMVAFLDSLLALQRQITSLTEASSWDSSIKEQIYNCARVANVPDYILDRQAQIANRQEQVGLVGAGMAFGGSAFVRSLGHLTDVAPELWQAKHEFVADVFHAQLQPPGGVITNVMGLAVENGPPKPAADLSSGAEINWESTTKAARELNDIEGLSILWRSKDKQPDLVKAAMVALSTEGAGKVTDTDVSAFMQNLDANHLTSSDLRAIIFLADSGGVSDPFLDHVRSASAKGPAYLMRELTQMGQKLNPEVARTVRENGLAGKLFRFTSDGKPLLERLNIDRTAADVQLVAAGVAEQRVPEILGRSGEIVREGDLVIVKGPVPGVFTIDQAYKADAEQNLAFIKKILAYNEADLVAAGNNPTASYGKFLEFVQIANSEPEGFDFTFPHTSAFQTIKNDIIAGLNPGISSQKAMIDANITLLRRAMTGDPQAFNLLVPKIGRESLKLVAPSQFHATKAQYIIKINDSLTLDLSLDYDLFDKARSRLNIADRLVFAARKAHLVSVAESTNLAGIPREIVGDGVVPYNQITADQIANGEISITDVMRAVRAQISPVIAVDSQGVEAKVIPSVDTPIGGYSPRSLQLLGALEGNLDNDGMGEGRGFLATLIRRNLLTLVQPSRPESGVSDPIFQLVQLLGRVKSYEELPLPDGSVQKIGLNVYGVPVLPGVYHLREYTKAYARELTLAILGTGGRGIDVNALPTSSDQEDFIRQGLDQLLDKLEAMKPGSIDQLCEKLETARFVYQSLDNQSKAEFVREYANDVYLGNLNGVPIFGLNNGANIMFGKNLDELTIGQRALLHQFTQAPASFSPVFETPNPGNPNSIIQYRDVYKFWPTEKVPLISEGEFKRRLFAGALNPNDGVLKRWLDKGVISGDEYREATRQLQSGEVQFNWKLPPSYQSDDLTRVKVSGDLSNANVVRTSFGTILDTGGSHTAATVRLVSDPLPESPAFNSPVGKEEVGRYFQNYFATVKRVEPGVWAGPKGPDGHPVGLFPNLEYFDGEKVVSQPGVYYFVMGPDGGIWAEGGAAAALGDKVQLGSITKLAAAVWLRSRGVNLETTLFDDRPGLGATLDGSPLKVANPAGGAIYHFLASDSPANKLTTAQDLWASSNAAIQRAMRDQMQNDPDAWHSWQNFLARRGMEQYVQQVDPKTGTITLVEAVEPTPFAVLGSDTFVSAKGAARFVKDIMDSSGETNPAVRAGLDSVKEVMTNDAGRKAFIAPDGSGGLGDYLLSRLSSTVNGNPDALLTKTATIAGVGRDGKLFTNTTAAVTGFEAAPGKYGVVFARTVSMKVVMVDGKPTWVQVPVQDAFGQHFANQAEGSLTVVDFTRTMAKTIGQRTGGIPPDAAPPVPKPPVAPGTPPISIPGSYTISGGDTLYSIAQRYGTTVAELQRLNPGIKPNALRVGQKITVSQPTAPTLQPHITPPPIQPAVPPVPSGITYTVLGGDHLSRIAQKFGVPMKDIIAANNITNPNMIRPGQVLIIPKKK